MLQGITLNSTQISAARNAAPSTWAALLAQLGAQSAEHLRHCLLLRDAVAAAALSAAALQARRAEFQQATIPVAQALVLLNGADAPTLAALIMQQLEEGGGGSAAVMAHWTGLGFPAAQIQHHLGHLQASPDLQALLELVLRGEGWSEAIAHFGAGHEQPMNWGAAYAETPQLHPLAEQYVLASRRARLMPSFFVLASIVLLAQAILAQGDDA